MKNAAWLGAFLLLGANVVACGDDSGDGTGGSGSGGATASSASTGSPTTSTSSPTAGTNTTDTSSSTGDTSSSSDDTSSSSNSSSSNDTSSSSDSSSSSNTGTGGGEPTFVAEIVDCGAIDPDITVTVVGDDIEEPYAYDPIEIDIAVGGVIRFDPEGGFHDFDSKVPGMWADTPTSAETCLQFNVAGDYTAFCSIHAFEATVTVTGN